jgi:alkylated DNA nucleotide flippase Atl1
MCMTMEPNERAGRRVEWNLGKERPEEKLPWHKIVDTPDRVPLNLSEPASVHVRSGGMLTSHGVEA